MYRYAELEDVLMKLTGLHETYRIALRGRVKHFQRLGLNSGAQGNGRKKIYNLDDIAELAFCFELIQFGMDPIRIVMMMKWIWPTVSKIIGGNPALDDAIFLAFPAFLNRKAVEDELESGPTGQGLFQIDFDGPSQQMIFSAAEVSKLKRPRRVVEIDLGALREVLVAALGEVGNERKSAT